MDPRAVRAFARDLVAKAADLRAVNARVSAAHLGISATWKDAKYGAFLQRLEEASNELAHFAEHAERYAEHLNRKAALVEQYLHGR